MNNGFHRNRQEALEVRFSGREPVVSDIPLDQTDASILFREMLEQVCNNPDHPCPHYLNRGAQPFCYPLNTPDYDGLEGSMRITNGSRSSVPDDCRLPGSTAHLEKFQDMLPLEIDIESTEVT